MLTTEQVHQMLRIRHLFKKHYNT